MEEIIIRKFFFLVDSRKLDSEVFLILLPENRDNRTIKILKSNEYDSHISQLLSKRLKSDGKHFSCKS